ncbi:hypothetical protein CSOJ01_01093 [Colletotrichum sojae]|uniref:Myb-like domain-containing protein n=1 Tax=Colletotrichum sojae TaxID=2175907 RepID=A0A8H6N5A9_9PEZI|nr:hypothetical protein CSOJ01_01093 [Colletotrichum sojae]
MNKNWNDRADKDLFFTILSVKNIGVISGSEWTTIGNYMRSMGYGFTNEGCRQHFQGLRRAQQKAESNGGGSDNPRNVDPTLNPITRRPGPGRGRPKKQQQQQQPGPMGLPPLPVQGPQPDLPQLHDQVAQAHVHETHHAHHALHAHEAAQAAQAAQAQAQAHAHETHPAHQAVQDVQAVQTSQAGQNPQSDQAPQISEIPRDPQEPQDPQGPQDSPPDLSESLDIPLKGDPLDISLKDDENDDSDEHAAKRIKLDDATQDQSIDDEAVLALAAHSNSSSVDAYASEYPTAGLSGSDPHAFPYHNDP